MRRQTIAVEKLWCSPRADLTISLTYHIITKRSAKAGHARLQKYSLELSCAMLPRPVLAYLCNADYEKWRDSATLLQNQTLIVL